MKLLHYGLQRSGTNFFENILNRKFGVQFVNEIEDRTHPTQKHVRLYANKNLVPEPQYYNNLKINDYEEYKNQVGYEPERILVVSKDPYSWLLSYKNWAKKCNWPKVNHHYIEEYNEFYKTWVDFSFQTDRIVFIRYLDLIEQGDAYVHQIGQKLGLQPVSSIQGSDIRHVPQSEEFSQEKLNYYLNEEYLKDYGTDELEEINELLDLRVLNLLGYVRKWPVMTHII